MLFMPSMHLDWIFQDAIKTINMGVFLEDARHPCNSPDPDDSLGVGVGLKTFHPPSFKYIHIYKQLETLNSLTASSVLAGTKLILSSR
jgi:hypothetical protein